MLFLVVLFSLSLAEPSLTLVAPDKVEPGSLVRVSTNVDHHGRKPTEVKFSWYATNAIDSENLGDRFIFSTKSPKSQVICVGSFYYSTGIPHLEQVTSTITVSIDNPPEPQPSPNPIPPDNPPSPNPDIPPSPSPQIESPKSELGILVATWGGRVNNLTKVEAKLLSIVYDKTINDISAGTITTKQDAIQRVAENTKIAVGSNYAAWVNAVLEPLRLELNRRALRIKTVTDFQKELIDIREGLNYLGRP